MTQTSPTTCVTTQGNHYYFRKYFFLLVFFCAYFSLLFASTVHAQGTQAGIDIQNTVTVNYQVSGSQQPPVQSSTTFTVDRKIDLVVTGINNANVTPGDTQSEVTFSLSNDGNDIQIFELTPDPTINSDDFDTSSCNTLVTAVTGTPLPGVTLPSSADIKLSPDQQASISVKCNIPLNNGSTPLSSGDTSLLSLKAVAKNNADGTPVVNSLTTETEQQVDTVFADGAGSDDLARDASHSARRTYTASTSTIAPTLNINKSILEVKDSSGGNSAVSGSEVTYKIAITTNGMGVINNTVISDQTPTGMTYKAGTIKLDNNPLSDSLDADQGDFGITTPNTATINLGNVTAGNQHEILLTYIIN